MRSTGNVVILIRLGARKKPFDVRRIDVRLIVKQNGRFVYQQRRAELFLFVFDVYFLKIMKI